jgi:hypothetical protein
MPSTSVRVVKKQGFELPGTGLSIGTLSCVEDLGLVASKNVSWKPREKVRLTFALDQKNQSGQPITLRVDLTKSLWEKSNLTKYIDALCGSDGVAKGIPEGETVELTQLIGRSCQLLIKHHTGSDGRVWANVESVLPLAPGQVGVLQAKPATVNPTATIPEPAPATRVAAPAPVYNLPNAGAATSYVISQPVNGGANK